MQQGVKKALERLYMNKMSHFEIYKKNQVLYIEYGFIYVTLLFFMMFLPFKGVTNLISSVILFWLFIAMIVLLINQNINKELDFEDLFQDTNLPSKLKLFLTSIIIFISVLIEINIFNKFETVNWLFNFIQMLITILQSLLIALFTMNKIHLFAPAVIYTALSSLITCITLFIGGIFLTPYLLIALFRKKMI